MRQDYTSVKNIYIVCGKTDMRKGIDGLATLIQDAFELDPYSVSIF
ncbi:IS66 family insertion sequence element accessory protein TnpB [Bacillus sp. FJAT-49731]|nr:IS66 family insertion sequence element accessory protein TnpB [Lederbergia citrea]